MADELLRPEAGPAAPLPSGALAHDILDALTASIAVLDGRGVVIAVNEAWRRFARANGCADEACYIGASYLQVCEDAAALGEQTAAAALGGLRAVIAGEQESFTLEYPCHSPTERRWFLLRASRFLRDGATTLVVAHEDISLRKWAEERCAYHAQLLANVNDVIVGTDQQFTITFWNRAAQKLFGWQAHEVIGRPTQEILRTEMSEADRAASIRDLNEKGFWIGEVVQHARDGSPLNFEASIMALYDHEGQVTGYVSANHDITERKRAELALKASEARFRNLTSSLPDAVYILDLTSFAATYFNHDLFLGYCRDELMALGSILHQIHPEDSAGVMAYWQQAVSGAAAGSHEYRLRHKAGHWEWVASRVKIVAHGADEQPREIMIILTTITERKQAEAELLRAKEALEAANRELQQALAREQQLARTDELTGVYNRRHFFDLAQQELAVAQRYGHPLSVILFDIDFFKQINDNFGHQIGDEVIQQVAAIGGAHLREADVFARYGGEEFILLLPNTSAQQARFLAERIRKAIAGRAIAAGGAPVRTTISAGIAELAPGDETIDRLIQRADQALYGAKEGGRNRSVLWGRPLVKGSSARG
jgi:diguanylate cyclase (GGDEF)-like protein/PAS domain S-box-containing protein